MALQDENVKLREELTHNLVSGDQGADEASELIMINNGLNTEIKRL